MKNYHGTSSMLQHQVNIIYIRGHKDQYGYNRYNKRCDNIKTNSDIDLDKCGIDLGKCHNVLDKCHIDLNVTLT